MSRLVRWDPFREMAAVRGQMDRIFEDFYNTPAVWQRDEYSGFMRLALDVSENDDAYTVHASLPGVNPDDIDISFTENTLTIKGETHAEEANENEKWHLRERRFGSFMRSITLPTAVNADQISAEYENGVLILTLPKAEEVKPRKISVNLHSGNGHKVIEG